MSGILVYSEKESVAWELLARAVAMKGALGGTVGVALLGSQAAAHASAAFTYGADMAFVSEHAALADLPSDVVAAALQQIIEQAGAATILIGSTLRGKALAPRLAQKLSAGCVTDAIGVDIEDGQIVAHRYAYGGKTVAAEAIISSRQVVALLPRNAKLEGSAGRSGEVVSLDLALAPSRLRVVERQPRGGDAVAIESAARLVGVGRGLKRKEDLALIEQLAHAVGAAIGCTRTLAYDYKWLPEAQLIGLSGKRCAPKVYIGVGLSGQIQHMMGVSAARLIVAINRDKDAPIFEAADYGVVGDMYQVIPRLIACLQA